MDKSLESFDAGIDLVRSMENLRDDPSPEGKLQFFRQLKAARFLVPCRGKANSIVTLNTDKAEAFLPAFTAAQELSKCQFPFEKVRGMSFDALKHLAIDNPTRISGIAINPFGKALLLRHPQLSEIDSATEGMTLKRTDYQGKLQIKPTADYPIGLPKALSHLLDTRSDVYRAWILSAQHGEDALSHKLFLIDFDGDRRSLFPLVAKAVQPFMKPGESFELLKADYTLLQQAEKLAQPLYVKK